MDENLPFILDEIHENLDNTLLLCKLSEAGIDNNLIEDPAQLYLILDLLKDLSEKSINNLKNLDY